MRQVIVIKGRRHFKSFLRRWPLGRKGEFKYILCEEIEEELISLLEEKGFEKCTDFSIDETYREKFIRECIDLVSNTGKELNSIIWWATDIASKNRFTSKLTQLLQQFLEMTQATECNDYEQLVIINPSWVIIPSLRRILESNKVKVDCRGIFTSKWREVFLRYLWRTLGIFYHLFRSFCRSIYARKRLDERLRDINSDKPYYVVKTFIYNHSFKEGAYHDVFFGRLPEFLKSRKNLLLYACILGDHKKAIANIANCKEYLIVPLEFFLSLADILGAIRSWIFDKVKVEKDISFFGYEIKDLVNNELLRTAKGVQFYQFLHYWCTKKLLKNIKAESFLMTHENNPWEKMCTLAIKEVSPKTKVIWYQNTVIPQAALSMFRGKKEIDISPTSDIIFTLGEYPKRIMQKYGSYENLSIEPSCGLKFEYLNRLKPSKRRRSGNILLALEGIFEVYSLVNYVLGELKDNSQYTIKIRTHPILPLDAFKHKLKYDLADISNFSISKGSPLKEDIEWADVVVYWGSMVALEALYRGRPIVHFNMGSLLSFDPLFGCDDLKWVVNEKDSLIVKIEEINSLGDKDFVLKRDKAKAYLQKYFFLVTEDNLSKFVN